MILHDEPLAMGVVVEVPLIGVIEAEQTEDGKINRNDRILAVAEQPLSYAATNTTDDLAPGFLDTITSFWTRYEALRGVGFEILGVKGAAEAARRIKATALGRVQGYPSNLSGSCGHCDSRTSISPCVWVDNHLVY